ncbi:transcription termination factor Rho [Anatilimnocola floriformis]|uniref:transcription termination factor Rho n=1 Tax=Anatilimnocola floriformis TaxID=2948575 RepID=UPI0020C4728D|nr:transcription termination factor Rho [Anatilimnocola floriformis]
MGKKKFRPRGSGGRGGQGGGYSGYRDRDGYGGGGGGGGHYGGGQGGGNGYGGGGGGRPRRRRRPQGQGGPGGPGQGPVGEGGERRPEDEFAQNGEVPFGGEAAPDGGFQGAGANGGPSGNLYPNPPAVEQVLEQGSGLLEMHPNGYGFLRGVENMYSRERSDPFVPGTMIERFGLREGVIIKGTVQPARKQQGPRLREITEVDGMEPEEYLKVKNFDQKTPINPDKWFYLETGATPLTTRVMDLLTPLGRGQRALIVAPPRSGKTILLQHASAAMTQNFPDVKQFILLIDERPEEVTDMKRNVKGEVVASSLDNDIESHVRLAQIVIERCKRLAEMGQDVFVLLDSITRLARAFNKYVGNKRGDGIQSGGLGTRAMDIPKKLFATARAFEEGGSVTIMGTALIETNSKMDDAIFQEFKGTGNMELVLDRKLAERRVFPAIDVQQSGTRREELLLPPDLLHAITMLRRTLSSMNPVDAMEQLTKQLGRYKTNAEFIQLISKARD